MLKKIHASCLSHTCHWLNAGGGGRGGVRGKAFDVVCLDLDVLFISVGSGILSNLGQLAGLLSE